MKSERSLEEQPTAGVLPSNASDQEVERRQRFHRRQRVRFVLLMLAFWTVVRGANDIIHFILDDDERWVRIDDGEYTRVMSVTKVYQAFAGYLFVIIFSNLVAMWAWPKNASEMNIADRLQSAPMEPSKLRRTIITIILVVFSVKDEDMVSLISVPIAWTLSMIFGWETASIMDTFVRDGPFALGKLAAMSALSLMFTRMLFQTRGESREARKE